jgi:hypothetical protein
MSSIHLLIASLLLSLSLSVVAESPPPSPAAKFAPRTIDWTDLMPEEDLQLLLNMPRMAHENLSDEELMQDLASDTLRAPLSNTPDTDSDTNSNTSSLEDEVANAIGLAMQSSSKERTWQDALVSTRVRPEFDNTPIRLAGFIVPLDFDDHEVISSFFLVPYFGACIHVPPPPPNQIIYIRYPQGLKLDNLYTPFWVSGTLKLETVENDMGMSSYSMTADSIIEYKEDELVD